MPYIKPERRKNIDPLFNGILYVTRLENGEIPVGSMNYLITNLLLGTKPVTYADYNGLVGMLECCKLEFYRRAVAAYEDEKIKENGDVYVNP